MNGRTLARGVVRVVILLGAVGTLAACATAQPAPQETSILDTLDTINTPHPDMNLAPCAAMNAATVCEKSTRLDTGHNCGCADPRAITEGRTFRF